MKENDQIRPESGFDDASSPASGRRTWILVVVLLVIPGALYAAVPAEAVFWGAALFAGKEVISRYRRFFDPRAWKR